MAPINTPRSRRWISGLLGVAYGGFYLYSLGDLTLYGPPGWGAYINAFSLDRALSARALFQFEGIAVVELGYLVWLVSPLNLLIAFLLSSLLAANVHGALYLRAQARACRSNAGILAGALPAVLAGGACCAPSLLLLFGIPGLGALGAYFGWLMPLSLLALMLNRIWQGRQGAPRLFQWRRRDC
jgi:hypothetical protein